MDQSRKEAIEKAAEVHAISDCYQFLKSNKSSVWFKNPGVSTMWITARRGMTPIWDEDARTVTIVKRLTPATTK
jgi:hypothetical protein